MKTSQYISPYIQQLVSRLHTCLHYLFECVTGPRQSKHCDSISKYHHRISNDGNHISKYQPGKWFWMPGKPSYAPRHSTKQLYFQFTGPRKPFALPGLPVTGPGIAAYHHHISNDGNLISKYQPGKWFWMPGKPPYVAGCAAEQLYFRFTGPRKPFIRHDMPVVKPGNANDIHPVLHDCPHKLCWLCKQGTILLSKIFLLQYWRVDGYIILAYRRACLPRRFIKRIRQLNAAGIDYWFAPPGQCRSP